MVNEVLSVPIARSNAYEVLLEEENRQFKVRNLDKHFKIAQEVFTR